MDDSAYANYRQLEEGHFWRIAKRRLVMEWLGRYGPRRSNLRLLDIGGCVSMICDRLAEQGRLTVVEPNTEMVDLARQMNRGVFTVLTGSLPHELPQGPFDVITLFDVLEHVDDDEGSLQSIYQRLGEGGVLCLTVPALPGLWSGHDVVLHHKRRYVRKQLESRLSAAGFQTVRLSYYTSLLLPLVAASRMWSRWRSPDKQDYDLKIPPGIVNGPLGWIMSAERVLLRFVNLPIGSSLIGVAIKSPQR